MKIKIYVIPSCQHCEEAKKYFKSIKQKYTVVDISKSNKKNKVMVEKSHQGCVPVIEIGNQIIIGFDKEAVEKSLKKK